MGSKSLPGAMSLLWLEIWCRLQCWARPKVKFKHVVVVQRTHNSGKSFSPSVTKRGL